MLRSAELHGHLANSQLVAAAVASWTITKAEMVIQPNMAIQANPHKQLVIE